MFHTQSGAISTDARPRTTQLQAAQWDGVSPGPGAWQREQSCTETGSEFVGRFNFSYQVIVS